MRKEDAGHGGVQTKPISEEVSSVKCQALSRRSQRSGLRALCTGDACVAPTIRLRTVAEPPPRMCETKPIGRAGRGPGLQGFLLQTSHFALQTRPKAVRAKQTQFGAPIARNKPSCSTHRAKQTQSPASRAPGNARACETKPISCGRDTHHSTIPVRCRWRKTNPISAGWPPGTSAPNKANFPSLERSATEPQR